MPIYAYHCQACGERFDLLVRSSTVPTCPHCGATALDKCVTAPTAPGKSKALLQRARAQAAKEGHFSHYAPSERPKA